MTELVAFWVYLGAGRLLTWSVQVSGPAQRLKQWHPLLKEGLECDYCSGFWVYLGLAALLGYRWTGLPWPGLVEYLVVALFSSLVSHLLRLGWQDRFSEIHL